MKKMIQVLTVGMFVSIFSVAASAGIQPSLRGDNPLDKGEQGIAVKKPLTVKGGIERSFKKQPPMIPHGIEKDRITLKGNTCMKCHSAENAKKEKAPEIGESHYLDRDGNKLAKPSSRRWFCNQCHAPQVDAQPLVELDYQPQK
ncbi:MAG: nitrate reductase cytochrome c-type subunit [Gammaproteobacteria bacterium]|nr:nitrate reductase cytochrome c-type subunit [Gammaproteobacteria bacterium]MBU1655566.1 nitrate reductase cytochrome c-type subunit [Gammaproteobacteria bacterium]MBU1960263.1 nitrate reductase cytochrome c-type subunit [Gammaproteobacteria bacterium]